MTFRKSNGETHLSLLEAYKDNIKDVISSMVNKIKKGSNKTDDNHKYDNYGDYYDSQDDDIIIEPIDEDDKS